MQWTSQRHRKTRIFSKLQVQKKVRTEETLLNEISRACSDVWPRWSAQPTWSPTYQSRSQSLHYHCLFRWTRVTEVLGTRLPTDLSSIRWVHYSFFYHSYHASKSAKFGKMQLLCFSSEYESQKPMQALLTWAVFCNHGDKHTIIAQ